MFFRFYRIPESSVLRAFHVLNSLQTEPELHYVKTCLNASIVVIQKQLRNLERQVTSFDLNVLSVCVSPNKKVTFLLV